MKKKIPALLLVLIFICTPVMATESCSSWAEAEVFAAIETGLVPKSLQKDYTKNITREAFAHLVVAYLQKVWETETETLVEVKAESPFTDTQNPYITAVYELEIVNGKENNRFDPHGELTRQEAAKILSNTYLTAAGTLPQSELSYNDADEIAPWAQTPVAQVSNLNVMQGVGDNRFAPADGYTVEQSIVTFWRLYEAYQSSQEQEVTMEHQNPPITQMLTVRDGRLMAGDAEVVLKGVNLGGWLLTETWMSPILDPKEEMAHTDMMEILTHRFGKGKANALITLYQDSFLTEADFTRIAAMGFNCVRIPFWYGSFMTSAGEWLTASQEQNPGFQRLDWALRQCEKNGLYAVLDMHGCPGGQSTNHSTGTIGKCELYQSEAHLEVMERLWRAIARRYRGNPVVAAYDIMNEPQNNTGYQGPGVYQAETPNAIAQTNYVYDRMVKAIRTADPTHVITIEGIWSMHALPHPKSYGWTNMMYQLHIYDSTAKTIRNRVEEMLYARETWDVAVYAGEYNSGDLEEYAMHLYQKHGISRTKWTYKTVGREDNWGLYNKAMEKIDLETATYEEIKTAFGTEMLTENGFALNEKEYYAIK